jgi:hypothetical protein
LIHGKECPIPELIPVPRLTAGGTAVYVVPSSNTSTKTNDSSMTVVSPSRPVFAIVLPFEKEFLLAPKPKFFKGTLL